MSIDLAATIIVTIWATKRARNALKLHADLKIRRGAQYPRPRTERAQFRGDVRTLYQPVYMSSTDKDRSDFVIAYALSRIGFGINLFAHGLSRIGAIPAFEESLRNMFAKTWLPQPLVTAAGYAIPPIEFTIGALIILGLLLRPALVIGMLLIWLLTFGTCLLQQWSVASEQLIYMAFYAGLIACARFNYFSLDTLRKPPTPDLR